jgi:predicted nucleotidyltransferase
VDTQEAIRILRSDSGLRKDFRITSLRLFGSLVRGEAGSNSDIDILVEFDPHARVGLFEFAQLQQRLSELLDRRVDLVTPDALHEALRERILNEAVFAA